jgi:hypothetical protein
VVLEGPIFSPFIPCRTELINYQHGFILIARLRIFLKNSVLKVYLHLAWMVSMTMAHMSSDVPEGLLDLAHSYGSSHSRRKGAPLTAM